MEEIPLLQTKLYIPVRPVFSAGLQIKLVPRPQLIERLNRGLWHDYNFGRKLTLISAPAGFGKTTLASEWLHDLTQNQNSPSLPQTAWLSLDKKDNDPVRFLTYFIAALQGVNTKIGQTAQAMLQAQPPIAPEILINSLITEISALTTNLMLVLDDYHHIDNEIIHQTLAVLLEHAPPQFHILLISRAEFPFSLSRLHIQEQIIEIKTVDLRFALEEVTFFLNEIMGLHLSTNDITMLETRTEGWITSLRLVALAMQTQLEQNSDLKSKTHDQSEFITQFSQYHHHLLEYLGTEVLHGLPPETQRFLVESSILDELNVSLCQAVTGQQQAPEILADLERANLFIVVLDPVRQIYRYHHLFRDFLRVKLQQSQPSIIPKLQQRAAFWYEQHGLMVQAIEYGLEAQAFEWAAQLIIQQADSLWTYSDMDLLCTWIGQLPAKTQQQQPKLILLHAWALLVLGQLPKAEWQLQRVERLELGSKDASPISTELRGLIALIKASIVREQDVPSAITLYQSAQTLLATDQLNWQGAVHIGLGFAYLSQGDLAAAKQSFSSAGSINQAIGNIYAVVFINYHLGQILEQQGQLQQAAATYRHAVQLASQKQQPMLMIAWPYLGLASILREQNRPKEATNFALQAIRWGKQTQDKKIIASSYLVLAQIELVFGQRDKAKNFIHQALLVARESNMATLISQTEQMQVKVWLTSGDLNAALNWATESGLAITGVKKIDISPLHSTQYILLVRIFLAQAKLTEALLLLKQLKSIIPANQSAMYLELNILQALIYAAQKQLPAARQAIKKVLTQAKHEDYRRIFLDEGPAMATLLHLAADHHIEPSYTKTLLQGFGLSPAEIPAISQALIEPLSPVELDILRLLSKGLSNQKIAAERVVTINTVKWHLRNIYGKLGVKNRTSAVDRARSLNLI